MKRAALKPGKPLERKTRLKSGRGQLKRSRLKPRGKHGTRYPKSIDRPFRAWMRLGMCCVVEYSGTPTSCRYFPLERPGNEPCHVKPWGSSGRDRGNIVTGCPGHHDEQEGHTREFEAKYGLDLPAIAQEKFAEYEAL